MKEKWLGYLAGVGVFLLKKVLVFVLAIVILAGLSFFIWKGFTPEALSERLIWSGLAIGMFAGILVFGQTVGGRDFGVPGQFIQPTHAAILFDWNREIRRSIETRFGFPLQTFLIGAFTFLIGMLVQILFK